MFKGSYPALITPFTNGELDLETLKKLVEWHIGEGTNGFVPVGTTGESPTLSHAEHEAVVEEVVRACRRPRAGDRWCGLQQHARSHSPLRSTPRKSAPMRSSW